MNDEQKLEQERLLREGSGWDCYFFASYVKGADVAALQKRVLEIGDGDDCYCFAEHVKGADKEALLKRIKELWGLS